MSRLRVMVVDEHEGFREAVCKLLGKEGYDAYPAADGIDALRQIYHVMPHLIVSDAALANLSGFEFLPFVSRRFPSIGVIAMGEQPDQAGRKSKVVADMFLPRQPFDAEALLESADEVIARRMPALETKEVDCA